MGLPKMRNSLELRDYINQLRKVKNKGEILGVLKHLLRSKHRFTLWQKRLDGERILTRGQLGNFEAENQSLVIYFDKPQEFNFETTLTLYIYSDELSLVAKLNVDELTARKAIFRIPNLIFLMEKRKFKRYQISKNEAYGVQFEISINLHRGKRFYNALLMDISQAGMSFWVEKYDAPNFYRGLEITIMRLMSYKFPNEFRGSVTYVKKITGVKHNDHFHRYKIGIKFNTPLVSELIQRFLSNIN